MSLRKAFASALQLLRAHQGLSQKQIANATDQSHISRLEAGTRSVSLEVSEELAHAIGLQPLSLLCLVYASRQGMTPREILQQAQEDLSKRDLMDVPVPSEPSKTVHPQIAQAAALKSEIDDLMAQGKTQAEVARLLDVSRSTVTKHLQKK